MPSTHWRRLLHGNRGGMHGKLSGHAHLQAVPFDLDLGKACLIEETGQFADQSVLSVLFVFGHAVPVRRLLVRLESHLFGVCRGPGRNRARNQIRTRSRTRDRDRGSTTHGPCNSFPADVKGQQPALDPFSQGTFQPLQLRIRRGPVSRPCSHSCADPLCAQSLSRAG